MSAREPIGRFEWERLVRRIRLPEPVRLTAFILATFADPDGSNIRPGMPLLTACRDKSERTCQRHLATLIALGLIAVTERGNQYGLRTSVYRLTAPDDLGDRVAILPDPRTEHTTPGVADAPTRADDTQGGGSTGSAHDIQVAGATAPRPVDNPSAPDSIVAGAPADGAEVHPPNPGEHPPFSAEHPPPRVSPLHPPTPATYTSHHILSSCVVAEVEGEPAELEPEDEMDYAAALKILNRLGVDRTQTYIESALAQATAEGRDPPASQLTIAAARLATTERRTA